MTQFLPSNLLALFAPREPLKYLPPTDKLPHEKNLPPYSGIADFIKHFESAHDVPPPTRVETKDERKERQKKERAEQVAYKLEQDLAMWDPMSDPAVKGDPYKTLFCARINYDTSESKLKREFDVYGPIKRLRMVVNKDSGKPRGYAFVEFEHERDMHAAYKHADGKKIDGRRILVDVERGRTVKGWRPRRLGGGLGNTRRGGSDVNTRVSGREESRDLIDERRAEMDRYPRRTRSRSTDRDRYRERDRDRERERRRTRSRERERRRRSRERRRTPDRDIVKKEPQDEMNIKAEPGLEDDKEQVLKRVGRVRSRSRDKNRRSRSRDRKRSRRSRSRERRSDRRRDNGESSSSQQQQDEGPYIKQELNNLQEYEQQQQSASGSEQQYGARLEDL